jgi:hypothetical protein
VPRPSIRRGVADHIWEAELFPGQACRPSAARKSTVWAMLVHWAAIPISCAYTSNPSSIRPAMTGFSPVLRSCKRIWHLGAILTDSRGDL